jgi:hypothetical protein
MNYPSIKTIAAGLQIDGHTARTIREVLDGTLDPCDVSPQAAAYERQCYHPPANYLLKLYAINELLQAHGVEYVPAGAGRHSPAFEYVNMGDTYTATVLRLTGGRYRIGCWGDIVERGNYA